MKRRCKNVVLNTETVLPWVIDCCSRHKRRYDFRSLFKQYGMTKEEYSLLCEEHDQTAFLRVCECIADEATRRIANRDLMLPPVRIRIMNDSTTGKIREIGCESPMQQVFDYIAVYSAMEIFEKRMVKEQASSLPKRGQLYGTNLIKHWIDADNDAYRYANRHGYHYQKKCVYFVKLDIRKCYPSARLETFMRLFRRDCGNRDILWLWEELLKSHRVDGYEGFMIGALPSQWACQYMLSFIYRFAKCQGRQKRGKFVGSVKHMLMFMDDMLLIGSNRTQLKKAVERTIAYTEECLGWEIKDTWHIRSLNKSNIDMMGYVIHGNGVVTIRDRNFIRGRRMALRCRNFRMNVQQAQRIMSYKGYFDHSNTWKVQQKLNLPKIYNSASRVISKDAKEKNNGNSKGTLWKPETE